MHPHSYFCYTMRETFMIVCMNDLTDLPHWHRKIFDPGFTFEWKSARLLTAYDVTPSMLDWVRFNPPPPFLCRV